MARTLIWKILSITVLVLLAGSNMTTSAQDSNLLARRVGPMSVEKQSLEQILETVSGDYGIPIGIEVADQTKVLSHKIDFQVSLTDLRSLFDSLTQKDPTYTWRVERGVVHFYPVVNRDEVLLKLRDTKMKHFVVPKDITQYRLKHEIFSAPELKDQMTKAQLEPMNFMNGASLRKIDKQLVFDEQDQTLETILDGILTRSHIKLWVLSRWGQNNELVSLHF
jgi:hypothetical protein